MYEAIIVGARVAGAAVALLLARKGHRVLLLDKYTEPGPVLSSHIIGEIDIYERLGISGLMNHSGIPPMTRMRVDLEGRILESDILVTPRSLCIRRELLDRWLLDEAVSHPLVTFRPRTKVIGPVMDKAGAVTGVNVENDAGRREVAHGRVVIGADGRQSTLASALKPLTRFLSDEHHPGVYYGYLSGVTPLPIPAVEWYWSGRDIILCSPMDEGRHCIALMTHDAIFRSGEGSPSERFMSRLGSIRTLAPRLKDAALSAQVRGAAHLPSYVRQAYGPGWALVGDAGAHLHPISGIGIDNAVCTAEMLAEELHLYFQEEKTWLEAMTDYESRRDERIVPQYHACLKTLARTEKSVPLEQLDTMDMLCTFPGLVHELATRGKDVYNILTEERSS
ncbi:NAD(P)/FAD-dependent oxidoreductase [Paenibacillus massiliensis]|uniref:NAD(P)/FAD-dependent oxidoreductase n=1 Tax=Paenibacillus massiliensis TaxID=225917 RepID=UPI000472DCBE|nr:FAD-dependent monooxygenase [Paenibacillus massiliensis]